MGAKKRRTIHNLREDFTVSFCWVDVRLETEGGIALGTFIEEKADKRLAPSANPNMMTFLSMRSAYLLDDLDHIPFIILSFLVYPTMKVLFRQFLVYLEQSGHCVGLA